MMGNDYILYNYSVLVEYCISLKLLKHVKVLNWFLSMCSCFDIAMTFTLTFRDYILKTFISVYVCAL